MYIVRPQILAIKDWLIKTRRDIHRHPELGYQEVRTAALLENTLNDLGIEVRSGVGQTGVVGLWRAEDHGPCLGLRADMDALLIDEAPGRAWCSTVPGVMHACGHDLHTTMLLGVARVLATDESFRGKLGGAVKFIFQPAEEGGAGAAAMIVDGVLENPRMDAIFAQHVSPGLEVGQVSYTRGTAMAATDNFYISVRGRGGHAAYPDLALDPIGPAADLVRIIKERAVRLDKGLVALCTFNAGTQVNIIPEMVQLSGTIRALDAQTQSSARELVNMTAARVEKETGLKVTVRFEPGYPMLQNNGPLTDFFIEVADHCLGSENVVQSGPSFAAEDMAYFFKKIPGVLYWLGAGRPGEKPSGMLHSPGFDPDEEAMPLGVELMLRLTEKYLAQPRSSNS